MKSLVNFAALLLVVTTAACSGTSNPSDVSTSAEPQANASDDRSRSPYLQNGLKVYRDPETGEFTVPPKELRTTPPPQALRREGEPAQVEPKVITLPDGSQMIEYKGRVFERSEQSTDNSTAEPQSDEPTAEKN
jgi:hypothetical protein